MSKLECDNDIETADTNKRDINAEETKVLLDITSPSRSTLPRPRKKRVKDSIVSRKIDNSSDQATLNTATQKSYVNENDLPFANRTLTFEASKTASTKKKENLIENFKEKILANSSSSYEIPEVHFIGEIHSGINFVGSSNMSVVSCKWIAEWGKMWSPLEGEFAGQSQYSFTNENPRFNEVIWNHPLDIHFSSASIQGWPRILLHVYSLDEFGRTDVVGYGFMHLPCVSGYHEITVSCWRPYGTLKDELQRFFLGVSPQLSDKNYIFGRAWEARHKLKTISSGKIKVKVSVIQRFFEQQSVQDASSH